MFICQKCEVPIFLAVFFRLGSSILDLALRLQSPSGSISICFSVMASAFSLSIYDADLGSDLHVAAFLGLSLGHVQGQDHSVGWGRLGLGSVPTELGLRYRRRSLIVGMKIFMISRMKIFKISLLKSG